MKAKPAKMGSGNHGEARYKYLSVPWGKEGAAMIRTPTPEHRACPPLVETMLDIRHTHTKKKSIFHIHYVRFTSSMLGIHPRALHMEYTLPLSYIPSRKRC